MGREVEGMELVNKIKLGQAQLVEDVRKSFPPVEGGPTLVLEETGAVRTSKGVQVRAAPESPKK